MRVLFWVIALPIIAIAMAFAVANHDSVTISLWPLAYRIEIPLYIAVTGALFLGFLVGIIYGWLGSLRVRHRARNEAKRAEKLSTENADLRQKLALAENATRTLPAAISPTYPSEAALRHIAGGGLG
jgi:putative membrane protein